MILHGSVIQADTIIGKHVLVIRQPALTMRMSLAIMLMCLPHATLCGRVQEGTHIGAGAVVLPNFKIGKWCTVGAGAVVICDILILLQRWVIRLEYLLKLSKYRRLITSI
jgi:acetyltransferase EpsM